MAGPAVAMFTRSTYVMRYIRQSKPSTTVVALGFFTWCGAVRRYHGMNFGRSASMNMNESPTVEQSLCALSDAIIKAADDLKFCRRMIDRARVDISYRASSVSHDVVRDAERVVKNLSQTDESLRNVLRDLQESDVLRDLQAR